MSLPKCFLEEKVAIVTGASAGIGRQVALALANSGVNLVLAARSEKRLIETQQLIVERTAVKAIAVPCDVSRLCDLRRLVNCTVTEFGGVDILVNNAGLDGFRPLQDFEPHEIEQIIQVNLTAAVQLTQLVIPQMLPRGWGHIVQLASLAGKFGPPGGAIYAATKAGLIAFTQSLRSEYRSRNISASAICPGFVESGGLYDQIRSDVGRPAPAWIGGATADQVARATLRAIRKDQPEVIVNSLPLRPFYALAASFPRLGEWLFRKFAARYFRLIARARHREVRRERRERAKAA